MPNIDLSATDEINESNLEGWFDQLVHLGSSADYKGYKLVAFNVALKNNGGTHQFQLEIADLTNEMRFNGTIGSMPDSDIGTWTDCTAGKIVHSTTGTYYIDYETFRGMVIGILHKCTDSNITQGRVRVNDSDGKIYIYLRNSSGTNTDLADTKECGFQVLGILKAT